MIDCIVQCDCLYCVRYITTFQTNLLRILWLIQTDVSETLSLPVFMKSKEVRADISDEPAKKRTIQTTGFCLNIDARLSEYTASNLKMQ